MTKVLIMNYALQKNTQQKVKFEQKEEIDLPVYQGSVSISKIEVIKALDGMSDWFPAFFHSRCLNSNG